MNTTSFVVNTGTQEGDQHEIARYQQYYQEQGVVLAAQPQPHGGFLLTTYLPQQVGAASHFTHAAKPAYAATLKQDVGATQHGYAAPDQYANPAQAGYGAPPQQQYASPAQVAPQQYAAAAQAGYGAVPEQHGGGARAGYGAAPEQYAGAAQAAYGVPPQQYAGAAQAAYGAPPQQYAAGAPQGSNPAYGAPFPQPEGAFGTPTARQSGLGGQLGNFTLMQKLKFAGTALFILGMAGFSFFLLRQAQSNIVLFENSLDVPGELSLAGKTYGSISPRQALRLELDAGNYEVSFTGNGAKLDGGTLTVPKGNSAIGYRAVYNLGGKKGLAVVTKYYGGSFEDRVVPAAEGQRVIEVPGAQSLDRIDEGFPDTITVPKHQSFGTLVRVCHIDEAKGTVGCPGW